MFRFSWKGCLLVLIVLIFGLLGGWPGLTFILSCYLLLYLIRLLWNRLFWKVSRRLTLSYFIMALTSFFMGMGILLIVVYTTVGLFMHYEVDTRFQAAEEELQFWHEHLGRFPDVATLQGFLQRFPGANALLFDQSGRYTAGTPHPMETRRKKSMELLDNRWYTVLNEPGTLRLEVPIEDILSVKHIHLEGMAWEVFAGKSAPVEPDGDRDEVTLEGEIRTPPFLIHLQRSSSLLDRHLFRSFYVGPMLSARLGGNSYWVEEHEGSVSDAVKSPTVPMEETPMLSLRISPRNLYLSLAPKLPGSPGAIIIAVGVLSALIVFLGAFTILLAATTVMKINRAIRKLSQGGSQFEKGNFTYRIPVRPGRDELTRLGLQFNRMAESIETYIEEEKVKNQMLKEIEIAMAIQRSLLPGKLDLDSLECRVYFEPCERVGGDYYDAFTIGEKHLFVIGDASGHGVPAAILMAMVKSITTILVAEGRSPDAILRHLHAFLADTVSGDQFITLQMAMFQRDHLHLFNAGHPPPVHIHKNGATRLEAPAMPVGLLDGPTTPGMKVDISQGDLLFFYTDGLFEAENPEEDIFGLERVMEVARQSPPHPDLIINNMLKNLDEFRKGVSLKDDLTLVSMRVS